MVLLINCSTYKLRNGPPPSVAIWDPPHLAPIQICEHKFPIIQYLDILPPLIYRHK
jgi:hypothetical protein